MGLRFLPHVHPVPRDTDVTVSPDVRDRFVTNCRSRRCTTAADERFSPAGQDPPLEGPSSRRGQVMSITSKPAHPNSGTHPPLPRPARGSSGPSFRPLALTARLRPGLDHRGRHGPRPQPPRPLAPRPLPPAPSTSMSGFRAIWRPPNLRRLHRRRSAASRLRPWHPCGTELAGRPGVAPRRHPRTPDGGRHRGHASPTSTDAQDGCGRLRQRETPGNAKPPPPESRKRGHRCQIAGAGQSSTSPCAGRS